MPNKPRNHQPESPPDGLLSRIAEFIKENRITIGASSILFAGLLLLLSAAKSNDTPGKDAVNATRNEVGRVVSGNDGFPVHGEEGKENPLVKRLISIKKQLDFIRNNSKNKQPNFSPDNDFETIISDLEGIINYIEELSLETEDFQLQLDLGPVLSSLKTIKRKIDEYKNYPDDFNVCFKDVNDMMSVWYEFASIINNIEQKGGIGERFLQDINVRRQIMSLWGGAFDTAEGCIYLKERLEILHKHGYISDDERLTYSGLFDDFEDIDDVGAIFDENFGHIEIPEPKM